MKLISSQKATNAVHLELTPDSISGGLVIILGNHSDDSGPDLTQAEGCLSLRTSKELTGLSVSAALSILTITDKNRNRPICIKDEVSCRANAIGAFLAAWLNLPIAAEELCELSLCKETLAVMAKAAHAYLAINPDPSLLICIASAKDEKSLGLQICNSVGC